ncbi:hypothetical protein [Streptomyces sp. NPDC006333]|uniref:hypothetical protein n=1 Tax=Streptomyces sp. NPDC006333 TaxID=3156753 RepID=UPI0033AE4AEC
MSGVPFSFADCEATFGPAAAEHKDREAREAPRFTPEQILRCRAIFATFRVPPLAHTEGHRDANES